MMERHSEIYLFFENFSILNCLHGKVQFNFLILNNQRNHRFIEEKSPQRKF